MVQREHTTRGRVAARIGLRLCVPLLLLASPGAAGSQDGLPNLRPVRPEGWSDSLVISNRQETNTETLRLRAYDRLFVDFAVINSGGSPTAVPFRIELFLNGRLRETFEVSPPLDPRVFRFREDYPLGRLSSGTHTLRVVVDGGEGGCGKRRVRQPVHQDLFRQRRLFSADHQGLPPGRRDRHPQPRTQLRQRHRRRQEPRCR